LRGRGDDHRAEFVEARDDVPVLQAALQNEHHAIALRDAERREPVCRAVAEFRHFRERQFPRGTAWVVPRERPLRRRLASEDVHDVEAKVEIGGDVDFEIFRKILVRGEVGLSEIAGEEVHGWVVVTWKANRKK
jgi:hypothetical protein